MGLLLNSQLLALAKEQGADSYKGKRVGRWGWGWARGQPPVSGQRPAFSMNLIGVSFHGLLQKPPLAQGLRETDSRPSAHLTPAPLAPGGSYRTLHSCLTRHLSLWSFGT